MDVKSKRIVLRPLRDYLAAESAGGVVLLLGAAVALVLANLPWRHGFESLWAADRMIRIGSLHAGFTVRAIVNDGLMTVFFLVAGLEIKRELVDGELRDRKRAALPVFAAVGGMIVPALLFSALTFHQPGSQGWGIPMATDIALSVGLLGLLGSRVPSGAKLFLLALAIVDDIGAIIVIAVFYGGDVRAMWLFGGLGSVLAALTLRRLGVQHVFPYVCIGMLLWLCLRRAGVHPTLAGVIMGLLTPLTPAHRANFVDADDLDRLAEAAAMSDSSSTDSALAPAMATADTVSVVEWLEHVLHPWTTFLIVPLFALANTGLSIRPAALQAALSSRVGLGVVVGLVVGKPLGIALFAWGALRTRLAVLPEGVAFALLAKVGVIAGIGFTVSLFVTELAYPVGSAAASHAKTAVLVASLASGLLGSVVLGRPSRRP